MKIALFMLAAFVAVASASSGWKPGYEYVYKVQSRTVVGIEGKRNQYAGVEMRIPQLRVQVRDPNTLVVKPENVRVQKVHQKLSEGWLSDDPDTQQLQEADTSAVQEPFLMHMEKGTVKNILVSGQLTPEAANIQKALASALQMDIQQTKSIERASAHSNQLTGLGSKDERVIYRTMEDAVNGECETLYDISALPAYMVKEDPSQIPVPEACPGDKYFEVVATTNFSNCDNKPAFNFASPSQTTGSPGAARNGEYWTRAEQTVYTVCGKSRSDYVIQRIQAKEVVNVAPFGYEQDEDLQAGASLNLTLKDVKQISSPLSAPQNPVKLSELAFEYPETEADSHSPARMGAGSPFAKNANVHNSGRYTRSTRRQQDEDDEDQDREGRRHHGSKHSSHESSRRHDNRRHGSNSREDSQERRHHRRQQEDSSEEQNSSSQRRQRQQNGSSSQQQPKLRKSEMIPLLQFGVTGSSSKYPDTQKIQEIASDLAAEIADDLEDPSKMPEKQTAAKAHQLSRAIAMLDEDQIREAYKQAQQKAQQQGQKRQQQGGHKSSSRQESSRQDSREQDEDNQEQQEQAARNIFIDAAVMSGSNPAIMFIKEQVEQQKLKGERASQALMAIPKYAKTPTKQLIDELFDLVKKLKDTGKRADQPETTALLAWSSLIQQACMNPQAQREKYPKAQYGKFCHPQSSEIKQKWVPYVVQRLRDAKPGSFEEAVLLTTLGNIGHESILPALKKYLSGAEETSNHARTKAIFALKNIVLPRSHYAQNDRKVKEAAQNALTTIFSSQGEQFEARMAAFSLLVYSDAPFYVWQKAALRTWFEKDNQVNSFISSTLRNLAQAEDPKHYSLAKKAQQALKLAKPDIQQGAAYSQNLFSSTNVDDWNVASFVQMSIFGGRGAAPGNVYVRANVQQGGFSQSPLEAQMNASALYQLVQDAIQDDKDSEQQYPELARLTRVLGIQSRKNGPAEGSAYLSIKDMQRMFPIDETLAPYFQSLADQLQKGPKQGKIQKQINYQKAIMLDDIIISVPTVTGIPVVWTLKAPALFSVQGHAKAESKDGQIKATATLKPVLLSRKEAALSFVEPLSMQRFSAGVVKHYQVYTPAKVEAKFDVDQQKASLTITPGGDEDKKQIQIAHFHVTPFTQIKKLGDFQPLTKSGEVKKVHYQQKPRESEMTFGQKALGLKFRFEEKTEHSRSGFASWAERVQKHSPMSAAAFWAESPSNAPREYSIYYDQDQSETEQIKATIQVSSADKKTKGDQHDIQTKPRSLISSLMGPDSAQKTQKKHQMVRSLEQASSGQAVTVEAEVQLKKDARQSSSSDRTYAASATIVKGTFGLNEKASIHFERSEIPGYDSQSWELCAEAQAKFPTLPAYSFKDTIQSKVEAEAKAQVSYGQRCSQPQIKFQVQMERSEGQKQQAEQSTEAKQCREDNRQGQELSPSCRNATLQAATLNEYDIKIEYQQISDALKNATFHVEDLATAALYPYMSQDRLHVQNKDGQIKIHAKVHQSNDEADYLNVRIEKPSANIHFTAIPFSQEAEIVFPLNARQSLLSRAQDYALGGNDQKECTLERQQIVTFDNSSYEAELSQDNYHLLAKDSTKQAKFAVLARQSGQKDQMKVKIIVRNQEVKLTPSQGNEAPKAEVNGKQVQVPKEKALEMEDKHGEVQIRLQATRDGYIQVEAPQEGIQVTTDGERIVIEASESLRDRLTGLCGNFNGEQSADLQTPEQCVESPEEPEDFVDAFEVPSDGSSSSSSGSKRRDQSSEEDDQQRDSRRQQRHQSRQDKKSQRGQRKAVKGCTKEKDAEVAKTAKNLSGGSSSSSSHDNSSERRRRSSTERRSSHEESRENQRHSSQQQHGGNSREESRETEEIRQRHKVIARQGQKCISARKVPECRQGQKPKNTFAKQVEFVCMDASESRSKDLEQRAEQGQNLQQQLQQEQQRSSTANHSQKLYLPSACQKHQ
jgi:hypothetical protein